MIVHRRRWCPVWVGVLTAIGTVGLFALAADMGSKGIEMIPLLFTTTALTLTVLLNVTTYSLSPEGLHVREGVIPGGYRDVRVGRKAVSGVYWRYKYRAPTSGEVSHWAAGVSTVDGLWVDAPPQYGTELEARDEALRMGRELGLSEANRFTGEQPKRDLRVLGAILYWSGLTAFCLVGPLLLSR